MSEEDVDHAAIMASLPEDVRQYYIPRYWYVATIDYLATGEGHTRAIWIGRAKDEEEVKDIVGVAFGRWLASGAEITQGLTVSPYYLDLLTEYAKKMLLRLSSGKPEDRPGAFTYTNMVFVNYS